MSTTEVISCYNKSLLLMFYESFNCDDKRYVRDLEDKIGITVNVRKSVDFKL